MFDKHPAFNIDIAGIIAEYTTPVPTNPTSSTYTQHTNTNNPSPFTQVKIPPFKGKMIRTLSIREKKISDAVELDNKTIAVCDNTGHIHIWDTYANKLLSTMSSDACRIGQKLFRYGENLMSFSEDDKRVHFWDLASEQHIHSQQLIQPNEIACKYRHSHCCLFFDQSEHPYLVLVSCVSCVCCETAYPDPSNRIYIHDLHSGKCVMTLTGHTSYITCVRVFDGGRRLMSCSHDKTIRVWDIMSGRCLQVIRHTHHIERICILRGEKQVASVQSRGPVNVWDIELGERVKCFDGPFEIHRLLELPGNRLACLTDPWRRAIRLYVLDLKTGKELYQMCTLSTLNIKTLRDGRILAIGPNSLNICE